MKFIKYLLLCAALSGSALAQQVIYGTDPTTGKTFPLAADLATKTLKVTGGSGGGGGSGGSTTPATPQSIRLSDGSAWQQAALDRTTAAAPFSFRLSDGSSFISALPVSASALPLPTGAATAANQISGGPQLGSGVITATTQRVVLASDGPTVTTLTSIESKTPALVGGRQPVDGSGVTQPVSASALPLPTGASTETTLAALNTKVTAVNTGAVVVSSSALPTGASTAAKQPALGTIASPSADVLSTVTPTITATVGTVAATATGPVASADLRAYGAACVTISGTWTGTLTFQSGGADNTYAAPTSVMSRDKSGSTHGASSTVTTANGDFIVPGGAWTRVQITTLGTGTVTATIQPLQNQPVQAQPTTLQAVSTVTNVTNLNGGQTAHSAASTGNPVRVGGRVRTAIDATLVEGDASDIGVTTGHATLVELNGLPEFKWNYAAASGGILNTTTAVTTKAAAGANIRNYIDYIQIGAEALGTATEVVVRDGAAGTVIWRHKIGTAGMPLTCFAVQLKGTANTLLEVATLTASTTGAVYVNMQGHNQP